MLVYHPQYWKIDVGKVLCEMSDIKMDFDEKYVFTCLDLSLLES